MIPDNSPEAVLSRLDSVCREVYRALQSGMKTADFLHSAAEWDPEADWHLHRHMTRRDAMEDLKQFHPELEDSDNLGLPMSGLILRLPDDIIRVWHTAEQKIPRPDTEAKLRFVQQLPERVIPLIRDDELPLGLETMRKEPARNHSIIQWTAVDQEITRFALVRPIGVQGGAVKIDWRTPLLGRYAPVEDITYRRKNSGEGAGEAEAK